MIFKESVLVYRPFKHIYVFLFFLQCNCKSCFAILHDIRKQTESVTYLSDSVVGLGFCWVTFLWACETDNVEMQSNDVVWLDKICERYCWRLIVVRVVFFSFFFFLCKHQKDFRLAAYSFQKTLHRWWQNFNSHIKTVV